MFRKIADLPRQQRCLHRDHDSPSYISLKPGIYEHVCPGCHKRTIFTVSGIFMSAKLMRS